MKMLKTDEADDMIKKFIMIERNDNYGERCKERRSLFFW